MVSEVAAQAIREAGVCDGLDASVNELLTAIGLIDHHVHGVVPGRVDDETLIRLIDGAGGTGADGRPVFDTQTWQAVRRWCAPLLRAPAHLAAEDYLVARRAYERLIPIAQMLLPRAGLERVIVDDGVPGPRLTSPAETGALAGARASRIARLETLAEQLIRELPDPATWPDAFRARITAQLDAEQPAIGFKTVLAYRGGFDRDLSRPGDDEVSAAAVRWSAQIVGGTPARLLDATLLRFGIWTALDTGRALQVHTGIGGSLDLRTADPLLLDDFLRATEERAPIMLLHTYPFQRSAGHLARTFGHVHLDVGLAIVGSGAASEAIVRESLESAPFTRILFSSDAGGAPELHLLGSWLFRRAMSRVLGDWVAGGDWSRSDAERVIRLVGGENARRVYRLSA